MVTYRALSVPLALASVLLLSGCATSAAEMGVRSSAATVAAARIGTPTLLPALRASLASFEADVDAIPAERKAQLQKLATFVRTKRSAGEPARLTFICTHNSRRSHFGQMWATAAAAYYGVDGVLAYSGGLEVTAFNPRAIAALERAGFQVANPGGDNPHVKITYASDAPPLEDFSKKYSDPFNPQENFAAVMTCSHADGACPLVVGATARVAIPYEDPKSADGKPEEAATYDARSRQIATEMLYVFSLVKADARVSRL